MRCDQKIKNIPETACRRPAVCAFRRTDNLSFWHKRPIHYVCAECAGPILARDAKDLSETLGWYQVPLETVDLRDLIFGKGGK